MPRPTARVLALLELLQSGGLRTVGELAQQLGVDERTVRRYVEHLVDLDIPVESLRGRYGGYRLRPGYRLPPLMLRDDEALAVMLSLWVARRRGALAATGPAGETAAAKIRRVLPERLLARLDDLRATAAHTGDLSATAIDVLDPSVLLTVAEAVRHSRPIRIRYRDRLGQASERTLHPSGLVAHADRWYVTATDADTGEERTLRVDRIADARTTPGTFQPPDGEPAERLLASLRSASYRHHVIVRVRGRLDDVRSRLPASVATVTAEASHEDGDWVRVEFQAERLDWVPALLVGLDAPFLVERPAELADLMLTLAERLRAAALGPR